MQLQRIGLALGLPATSAAVRTSAPTAQDALREAMAAGIPVTEGRPDDPMLDFLDL